MKYYKCNQCGNIISMVEDSGVIPICCNEEMELIDPKGPKDEHAFLIDQKETINDIKRVRVCIGKENLHPMSMDHYIEFIGLITDKGTHTYFFHPGNKPCARFFIGSNETLLTVYMYCNIHGMFKLDLD